MSLVYLRESDSPHLLHGGSIWALDQTDSHVISGSSDGHIRIFSTTDLLQSPPLHDLHSHPLAITSLSTTRDGRHALGTSLDGTVTLVDISEGKLVEKLETARDKSNKGESELPAYSAAVHPSMEAWAWTGRSARLAIRRISPSGSGSHNESATNGESSHEYLRGTGKIVDTGKGKHGMDVKFSPDGTTIAVSTEAGQVVVVDVESQAVVATYASHAMAVRTVAWSPDSQWLYSGADDQRIVVHDVRAGSKSTTGKTGEGAVAIMQGHQGWVLRVAASPDGKLLGSGGADNLIKLWDIGQRTCVSTSTAEGEVWGLSWQPVDGGGFAAGKQFVTGGEDRKISLYRAAGSV